MEVTAVSSTHLVSTLTLTRVSASVSGLYTCVAINSAGVAASSVSLCHMFCTLVYINRFQVRLSMAPHQLISIDLWLPILLGFFSVFFD